MVKFFLINCFVVLRVLMGFGKRYWVLGMIFSLMKLLFFWLSNLVIFFFNWVI